MLKKIKWPVWMVMGMMLLAILACNFSFSTAKLENIRLAVDEDGNNKTTTFTMTDTVYIVMDLENAPDDTEVSAVWIVVDAPDVEPGTRLGDVDPTTDDEIVTLETGSGSLWFSMEPASFNLPPGKYKVEISLNGEREATLEFDITAE